MRARKLGREFAIKVLPEAFTRDVERLSRFEGEARILASLNHAHIAGLYGMEEFEGQQLQAGLDLERGYDVAPDGRVVAVRELDRERPALTLVENRAGMLGR